MARYLPAGVALLLIFVGALVQGSWSERWATFPELQVYADQLAKVPTDIGSWHSKSHEEPSKRTLEEAGAVGSLSRDFTNENGTAVSVFIVTGRLQDMFYHEPKRCYRAAGFEMQGDKDRREIPIGDGETADFFSGRFVKIEAAGKQDQVVYWSWNSNGKWVATDDQKWVFRGQRRAVQTLSDLYAGARRHGRPQSGHRFYSRVDSSPQSGIRSGNRRNE